MDTEGGAAPAPADGDAMDTGEVRTTTPAVRRPVLKKRGAYTTKQRRRKALKASKAAAVAGRRVAKAAKKGEKKASRVVGKGLWAGGGGDKE